MPLLKHWYETDLRIIKSNACASYLNHKVTMQIIELYKNWLSYDMEVCLSTPFQPYVSFYC